jgi:hypothetical protein
MKTVIHAGSCLARAMLAVALLGCGSTDDARGNADDGAPGIGDDAALEPASNDGAVKLPGDDAVAPAGEDGAVNAAGDDAAMRADVRAQPDASSPSDAQLASDAGGSDSAPTCPSSQACVTPTPDSGGQASPEGGTCPASCTTYTDCNSCPQHPFGGWSCNGGVCQFMG